ncbi:hypothetical protein B1A99_23140 [Cohnella sp. CIP 111063]|uniref:hypothetical protein n=1 Tax=unclassified Cohnella TaxID=2636738 RepID=UPI000B8C46AF|nr:MULTISPECIES: hypothetical protein [unclassified Cohnella]OXS55616.1 hypothetical protein B1A99_23140 [Cohnella sp. CIP 111063]PRX66462.1 hypothetical protein B0G52_116141 [Cohnella sp. SGD-V74]
MNEPFEKDEQFANRGALSQIDGQPPQPLKHSGLGIASFVLSLVGIVSFVILTIALISLFFQTIDITQIVDDNGNRLMSDEEIVDKIQPYVGYLVFYPLLILVILVGLILGIVALARPGYKKVFAILGTVFNGLPLLFIALLFLIGLAGL